MKTKGVFFFIFHALIAGLILISCGTQNPEQSNEQARIDSLNNRLTVLRDSLNKPEANKKLVVAFYQELFGDKNVEAIDHYLLESYIQHNPSLPDGRDALKKGAQVWFKDAPSEQVDFQHIAADGDLVFLHVRSRQGNKTVSIVDIFRVENGKIAEHWDVIQEVPAKAANAHPMF
jgi:predicted SnoaL-like aldol condensation-catalyzing enzyme